MLDVDTQLIDAVNIGDVDRARDLIETQGASVNMEPPLDIEEALAPDEDLYSRFKDKWNLDTLTLIELAALRDILPMTQLLIDHGAILNSKYHTSPALEIAVLKEDTATAKLLIQYGANVDARADAGHSGKLLHLAAAIDSTPLVRLLYENDANDIDYRRDDNVPTALCLTAQNRNMHLAVLILEKDSHASKENLHEALDCSIKQGDYTMATLFVYYKANINNMDCFTNKKVGHLAINSNKNAANEPYTYQDIVYKYPAYYDLEQQQITAKEVCEQLCGSVPKKESHYRAHAQIVTAKKTLRKAEKNIHNLEIAIYVNNVYKVGKILRGKCYLTPEALVFVNQQRQELFNAIASKSITKVRTLLRQLFSIHTTTKQGDTLWHVTCASGSKKVLKLLLVVYPSHDVWFKENKSGFTPIRAAVANGHVDLLRYLLEKICPESAQTTGVKRSFATADEQVDTNQ